MKCISRRILSTRSMRVLVGFVALESVNNDLLTFEPSLNTDTNESIALAKSVMTFMVKGPFTSLQYSYIVHVHVFPLPMLLCYWRPALSAILGNCVPYRTDGTQSITKCTCTCMCMYHCFFLRIVLVRFCVLLLTRLVSTDAWPSCKTRVPCYCTKCPTFMLKMGESISY